ncbi:MAG: mechanosensitive ion channel family protein [Treponema sp.]|jgi:small-conductance mechanosensitive channel|nr:mechanosensitive ion channel family protein [Treponema sp.]
MLKYLEQFFPDQHLPTWLRFAIAGGLVLIMAALIFLVWVLFKRLGKKIEIKAKGKIKPLMIKKLNILSAKNILHIILFAVRIVKYLVTVFLFFITVPIIFGLFPQTEQFANTLFGWVMTPLKKLFFGVVEYIPKLITIIVICLAAHYLLKAIKFFAAKIEEGKLVLPGFYADWAQPTYNILRFLLYAFTLVMIYPNLPGSDSDAFKGVSVFVGVIVSLGSSSAIGNIVAGIVMTYMRPFKVGDRIQIQNNIGFVVEKTLTVVRIRTHKNEYITFPNITILNSSIINYTTSSAESEEGLILHADITFGYNTPWQVVHEVLLKGAAATTGVLEDPKPFVLQLAMEDNYCRYQINCYTKQVDRAPRIYAELFENIQNEFHRRGIDMTAPQYRIILPVEAAGDAAAFAEKKP